MSRSARMAQAFTICIGLISLCQFVFAEKKFAFICISCIMASQQSSALVGASASDGNDAASVGLGASTAVVDSNVITHDDVSSVQGPLSDLFTDTNIDDATHKSFDPLLEPNIPVMVARSAVAASPGERKRTARNT